MTVTVMKLDGSQEPLSDDAINTLRTQLRGQLVVSGDEQARTEPPNVNNAFGANLRRLGQIKAIYDPRNLFRINNNVLPAS
jgi:hypothetical protein